MGVVNVTPDSFFDGGKFFGTDAAVDQALRLAAEGAEILDIGGESSRPEAAGVSEEEELRRVIPVVAGLARRGRFLISIDTVKPAVARAAIDAGAAIINDVGASEANDQMTAVVAETGAGYVAMHRKGTAQTMQRNPVYEDVVAEVEEFFGTSLKRLKGAGVAPEQIVLDVGIGFGKSVEHNLQLLRNLSSFKKWGRPLVLGVSRKGFMGTLFGADVSNRLPASLACACRAVEAGTRIIRTHDVAATLQAVRMTEMLRAAEENHVG